MHVPVKGNEKVTKLLNDWYQAILQHQSIQATNLKQEVEDKLSSIKEDKNLLLYYSLLNFRYEMLTDGFNITKDSFNEINSFDVPDSGFLSYYYHFFKGIHEAMISNYTKAREEFEQAEKLLMYVLNELEEAEFNYRIASFHYQTYQPLVAIQYVTKAKDIFSKHTGYEVNVASCNNVYGLSCIDLRQFEQAEINLNSALDILQKHNEESLVLRVRHNLAWLYANQNLSNLAIRHVSEVTKKNPKHFKAIFVEAREYYKLGEHTLAEELIENGLRICNELKNKELLPHFTILKELNNKTSALSLEKVILKGISYFKKEKLWDCVQEYTEILANAFYQEENHVQASKYFYMSNEARRKYEEKGALK
ncbi:MULTISPECIES: RapH N-terminal domain-containing protein [Bacillus]|uniref:Histidine kinase n=1 Tax=Bacillus anthracis TaxID=1392 RepID=A0A0J1HUG0_BACAN|nr:MULTISPECIES: RapH N-terminal domain-containing protein [Bacillus]EDX66466.1 tetratricopeptide domain protein [Bacillus cereus NVH0597-99]MRB24436.1 hypothetical protein [Bacillus thuringiensis]KLV17329.1 histidine kinase [Bacillus anthracis]MCU4797656.1 RapH N-terminal domain-containing protein [Bacillus cereus]MCU5532885.1 RapH N-terminal domain-containing protein [Bacillus cereus]